MSKTATAEKPYTLYWRVFPGHEPTRGVMVGGVFRVVPKFGAHRGGILGTYHLYKELVADAQAKCVLIGVPKSRWMDIFDWNK